ncbi:MAG TPA: hypothetical protein PLT82_06485 [Candidatus Hydrogenedens sp.]|nr:hypothetical protein [Candidatus Hydrogenedens sp.]HOK08931.1 hypothetical protein [Candidatus Hydrogenedens sp.]HOL19740.1 hypothetical protein [Candidatus Hydrogenedens sp.]HPP58763.1 hypothetical protein [Candidatus Hydrogenedens sp.]
MLKRNLLMVVIGIQLVILMSGCTPKIGVSTKTIDFGKTDSVKTIQVWNDKFIVLKKLEFKIENDEASNIWIYGINPEQDVSKNRRDKRDITILVSREGLEEGKSYDGKLTIKQVDSKTKKEVAPVEISIKISK